MSRHPECTRREIVQGTIASPSSYIDRHAWGSTKKTVVRIQTFSVSCRNPREAVCENSVAREQSRGAGSHGALGLAAELLSDLLLEGLGTGTVSAFVLDDLPEQAGLDDVTEAASVHFMGELYAVERRRELMHPG